MLSRYIVGLVRAISCRLGQTSHQRATSKKRTKAVLPKCPLFGGSTVNVSETHMSYIQVLLQEETLQQTHTGNYNMCFEPLWFNFLHLEFTTLRMDLFKRNPLQWTVTERRKVPVWVGRWELNKQNGTAPCSKSKNLGYWFINHKY